MEAAALVAEAIGNRHPGVVEEQFGGVLRVASDLGEVAATGESWRVGLHDEQGDTTVPRLVPGPHRGDEEVAVDAVGDERLRAVDDVVVAVADGARGQSGEIRADTRFGHGDGGDQLARAQPWQPAGRLLGCAVPQVVRQGDVVVQADPRPGGAGAGPLVLLEHDLAEPEVRRPAATELGRCGESQEPGPSRSCEQFTVADPRRFPTLDVGLDLPFDELPEASPEQLVLVVEDRALHLPPLLERYHNIAPMFVKV